MNITASDRERIAQAVQKAELGTSGEIVPVILKRSDFYPAAHFRLSMTLGILVSIVSYYAFDFLDPIYYIYIQLPGILVGYALAYIPFFKRIFTTKSECQEEVRQRAIEIFHTNHVSQTKDRTGIMIYISLLEKRVEVLGDCGINEKVSSEYWNELVENLLEQIKDGHLVNGLLTAIEKCGSDLKAHFPIKADDTNEISNDLITD